MPKQIVLDAEQVETMIRAPRQRAVTVEIEQDEGIIVACSDVHIGDPQCDLKLFDKTIAFVEKHDNARLALNGDLINLASKSGPSNVYSQKYSNDEQLEIIVDRLRKVKDKIAFIGDGNHEKRAIKEIGLTVNSIIAAILKVPYTGPSCIMHIKVGAHQRTVKNNGHWGQQYIGFAHHLTGGGGHTKGAKINRVALLAQLYPTADFYIGGHNHNRGFAEDKYMIYDKRTGKVTEKSRLYFSSAGFVKYGGSYAEGMQLPPAALGPTIINLSGNYKLSTSSRDRISFSYEVSR